MKEDTLDCSVVVGLIDTFAAFEVNNDTGDSEVGLCLEMEVAV